MDAKYIGFGWRCKILEKPRGLTSTSRCVIEKEHIYYIAFIGTRLRFLISASHD